MIKDEYGKWRLTSEDLRIDPDDVGMNDDCDKICTYLETHCNLDARLDMEHEPSSYVNLYAEFEPFTDGFELYYYIHYANGDVSDQIFLDDFNESEKEAIMSLMREKGMDDLVKEILVENEPEWGDDD